MPHDCEAIPYIQSEWCRMMNYAKNGLPQYLDGEAKRMGRHKGRWGYREISSSW